MSTTTGLLALLLIGCAPPSDGGGGDTADTADTADSGGEVRRAQCQFGSLSPRTTSWSGGESIRIELDCENPDVVETVQVELGGVWIDAAVETVTDTTVRVRFDAPLQDGLGAVGFDLDVDGESVLGDVLRFRLDPDELSQQVVADLGGVPTGWGLPISTTLRSSTSTMFWVRPTGTAATWGRVLSDGTGASSTSLSEVPLDLTVINDSYTGRQAPPATWSESTTGAQAMVVPALIEGSAGSKMAFLTASDDGKSVTAAALYLDYATLGQAILGEDELASSAPVVQSLSATWSSDGTLKTIDAVIAGISDKDGSAVLSGVQYTAGEGSGVWVRNWQHGLSQRIYHVSPPVVLEGDTAAVLMLSEGEGGTEGSLLSLESGKVLSTTTFKDITAPVAVTAAVMAQELGDGLAFAILDESGALSTGQVSHALLDPIDVQELVIGSTADVALLSDTEEGAALPPLELRASESGDVYLAMRLQRLRGDAARGSLAENQSMLMAHWIGGDVAVSVAAAPDSIELLAVGGATTIAGSPGDKLTGSPIIFSQVGGFTQELGTHSADVSAELVLDSPAGWTVLSRDGAIYAVTPSGEELADSLPLDLAVALTADEVDGRLVVVGMLLGEDADGATTRDLGLVTIGPKGLGTATFAHTLTGGSIKLQAVDGVASTYSGTTSTETDFNVLAYVSGLDDTDQTRYDVAIGHFSTDDLPAAGEALELDLGLLALDATATTPIIRYPAVWLPADRPEVGDYLDTPLAEQAEVTSLGVVPDNQGFPDLFAAVPSAGGGYNLSVFVEGAAGVSGLVLDAPTDGAAVAIPEQAADLDGGGVSTVLMSRPGAEGGTTDLWEVVWDGSSLLQLPALSVPAWDHLDVADLDGDGLDDVMLQFRAAPGDDGTIDSPLSGMLLRSGGTYLSRAIKSEVHRLIDATEAAVSLPGDGEAVTGAVFALADSDLDMLVLSGTAGRRVTGTATASTRTQPPPIIISSWAAILE